MFFDCLLRLRVTVPPHHTPNDQEIVKNHRVRLCKTVTIVFHIINYYKYIYILNCDK